jgi:hypothetical protein
MTGGCYIAFVVSGQSRCGQNLSCNGVSAYLHRLNLSIAGRLSCVRHLECM